MASRNEKPANNSLRQKIILICAIVILAAVVVGITFVTKYVNKYTPSSEVTDYETYYDLASDELFIVFDNEQLEDKAIIIDDEVYLNINTVNTYLNSRFYWDSAEEILRYTLPDGLINITPDTASYTYDSTAMTADCTICTVRDGEMYLSLTFAAVYTDIRYTVYEDPGRLVISDEGYEVTYTAIKRSTQVREKGGIKSSILTELEKGAYVTVLETMDTWSMVCTEDGFIGYVLNKALGSETTVVYEDTGDYEEPVFTHITKDYTINMAWHQVTNTAANDYVESVLESTQGVNVISPTWFYLNDDLGGIESYASADYVTYCHNQGIEVWALVSNLEDEDVDVTAVLSTTSSRDNLVNNLISEAIRYDLDGINVDFEALSSEAGSGYLQFIRELSLKCANNGIVLSIDNYVPSDYTEFYDRAEQALFADYIVIMAYDEHYNGSDAGSVASLSFVSQGIADTLEEVPAEQIILGIPFYTRLWEVTTETDDEGNSSEVTTSTVLTMSEVESWVASKGVTLTWLDDCGQYYAEYESDSITYMIWVEDQNSIEQKLELMTSNNLAGASFWKLGYEKNTIWDTIAEYIN